MIELRQVVSYLLGLAVVVAILSAELRTGFWKAHSMCPSNPTCRTLELARSSQVSNPLRCVKARLYG